MSLELDYTGAKWGGRTKKIPKGRVIFFHHRQNWAPNKKKVAELMSQFYIVSAHFQIELCHMKRAK